MKLLGHFLEEVLGRAGAAALAPLVKADDWTASYIPTRAVMAWLSTDLSGTRYLPGTPTVCEVRKSRGGLWSGTVGEYVFEDATPAHAAAAVLHALGAAPGRPEARDLDLARLGKTVDALVKSAAARRGQAAGADTNKPAAAMPPQQPEPPQQPQATQGVSVDAGKPQKKPKLPRPSVKPQALPKVKLTMSESRKPCSVCGKAQFSDGSLTGCSCFKSLCKSAKVALVPGGYEVSFGAGWDREAIFTWAGALK